MPEDEFDRWLVEGTTAPAAAPISAAAPASASWFVGTTSSLFSSRGASELLGQLPGTSAVMASGLFTDVAGRVRATIEENRTIILKSLKDISQNRKAIVKACKVNGAVQLSFTEPRLPEARIDYLEHRAAMNKRVALGNQKMAEINTSLIKVNQLIMEDNADGTIQRLPQRSPCGMQARSAHI